jgi:hypothetical protein
VNHPLAPAAPSRRRAPRLATSTLVSSLVVEQLAMRERRVLSLIVAVRRALGPFARVADLTSAVQSALHRLSASGDVTHVDGTYFLARRSKPRRPTGN